MKDLASIDFKDNIRFVVRRYLKTMGIKVPKQKSVKIQQPSDDNNRTGVFGVCLEKVPSVNVGEDFYCSVPKFLVDSANFLQQHLETEGLFRKSGSIQRQKVLKQKAEDGEEFKNVQPHDVASLVKQFFRQLPEPLLTVLLHDCFIKTQRMEDHGDQTEAVLLLCLLLPIPHLSTLQFTMRFLAKVASCSQHSKMGTSNLAIVLTPNLIHNIKKEGNNASEKQLKEQTAVIDILLKNADDIGLVNEDIYERAKIVGDEFVDGLTSSGDEVDADLRRGNKRQSRARTRTGSLSGFVSGLGQSLSKFKTSSSKTPVHTHRRSRSVKAEIMRNKVKYNLDENGLGKQDDLELENFVVRNSQRMSLRLYNKRRPLDPNASSGSPAVKSRRMMTDLTSIQGISNPRLVSASTQMFMTPIKPLAPLKPLADMVKAGHGRILLSNETEHVKVVDAMSYVPSPSEKCHGSSHCITASSPLSSGSPLMSPKHHGQVSESPISTSDEFRVLTAPRRRVRRRHSSGATTCFSSSPRNKCQANSKNSVTRELEQGKTKQSHSPTLLLNDALEMSHISVAATVEPIDVGTPSARVLYSGSALHKRNANPTPCKFHRATPPMPASNVELREVLSQKI